VSLRQAPRFQAYFRHLEGREVMVMSRHDWERVSQLREGEMAQIDLKPTPIAGVAPRQADRSCDRLAKVRC